MLRSFVFTKGHQPSGIMRKYRQFQQVYFHALPSQQRAIKRDERRVSCSIVKLLKWKCATLSFFDFWNNHLFPVLTINAFIRCDREGRVKLVWVNKIFLAWPNLKTNYSIPVDYCSYWVDGKVVIGDRWGEGWKWNFAASKHQNIL